MFRNQWQENSESEELLGMILTAFKGHENQPLDNQQMIQGSP
jgi:hypothetical protein